METRPTNESTDPSSPHGGPSPEDWADFGRKLEAVMKAPLLMADPECRAIMRRLAGGPDPEIAAHLFQRLSDRGVELAMARHGAAAAGLARRRTARSPSLDDDDDGPPARLMFRL